MACYCATGKAGLREEAGSVEGRRELSGLRWLTGPVERGAAARGRREAELGLGAGEKVEAGR